MATTSIRGEIQKQLKFKWLRRLFQVNPINGVGEKLNKIYKKYKVMAPQQQWLDKHKENFQQEYSDLQFKYISAELSYIQEQVVQGLMERK